MKTIWSIVAMVITMLLLTGDLPAQGRGRTDEIDRGGLKVGNEGKVYWSAKILLVQGKEKMIVAVKESGSGGQGGEFLWTWIVVKGVKTDGLTTDGRFDGPEGWKKATGYDRYKVTGTANVGIGGGGQKTVLVIEPAIPKNPAPQRGSPPSNKGSEKVGAAAYDDFIEAVREPLIQGWKNEIENIKKAIRDDEDRLAKASTPKDRQHFQRLIVEYRQRLARVERNDPPYIDVEMLKKKD